jgi:N utilization substance protein A
MAISANRLELLTIARSVAYEKNIEEEIVLAAIEEAIQKAAKARYGADHDIQVKIDQKTGELTIKRCQTVVASQDEVENEAQQIALSVAKRIDPSVEVGHVFSEDLPLFDFGRVMSLTGKQVITQRVREAERDKQFEEYQDRVGEIVNGTVKRVEYGNVIVDLGKGEGIIRRDQTLPRENLNLNDRVRCYIYDVRREPKGPQIFLSRAHPGFMAKLFAQEVPEVYDGVIEIKAVARDPSSRAKIAVLSHDGSIDPVGACVGMRGSRVQAVVGELGGEKIDIIPWSPDPATFIVNALQPAEVAKVVLDEDENRVEVVVPDEQLSLAIGRRGQNVRLASQLTGWSIDILTEDEERGRREKEANERTELFMGALEVDEMMARLLVSEGFETIEELAYIELDDLANIEGFDEEVATELQARARDHLEREAAELDAKRVELGVEDELLEMPGVTLALAVKLGEGDVKTVEDLAGLVPDDLRGWYEIKNGERVRQPGVLEDQNLTVEAADAMIMAARVRMGWVEAPVEEEGVDAEADAAADGQA